MGASTAEPAHMVMDLGKSGASTGSHPGHLTAAGNYLYFTATDYLHGRELWRTDGTRANTIMLKDFAPGYKSSEISSLEPVGNIVLFTIHQPETARGLWRSDGSIQGTYKIHPGLSILSALELRPGLIVFGAGNPEKGYELWKTDGTAAGTSIIKDIVPGVNNSFPRIGTKAGNLIYFTASTLEKGDELWVTDGTSAGTRMIKDIFHGPQDSRISRIEALGSNILFYARDNSHGLELWISNGTPEGTQMVKDIYPGASDSVNSTYEESVVSNGRYYFTAYEPEYGTEIWVSDGTAEGTRVLRDFNPKGSAHPQMLVPFESGIAFRVRADSDELWKSDATDSGTMKIMTSHFESLINVNGTLFFFVDHKLWKSKGTPETTQFVEGPYGLTECDGHYCPTFVVDSAAGLLFFTGDDFAAGFELFRSDGTPEGTRVVRDMTPSNGGAGISSVQRAGDIVFFNSSTSLYRSDGTAAGTVKVAEDVMQFKVIQGTCWFSDLTGALWRTDGTSAGTLKVRQFLRTDLTKAVSLNGYLFVRAEVEDFGAEIWRSDGTEAGTVVLKDIMPGSRGSSYIDGSRLIVAGSAIYFMASDDSHGSELWITKGTTESTVLVRDLTVGKQSTYIDLDDAAYLQGNLYFTHGTRSAGHELWKTNGTASGTVMVSDIYKGTVSSYPQQYVAFENYIYFSARTGDNGNELWRTDGTSRGTALYHELSPGEGSSSFKIHKPVKGLMLLTRHLNTLKETYRVDSQRLQLLKKIDVCSNIATHGNALYFCGKEGANGEELWRSDGTPGGTVLVQNIAPGPLSSNPGMFTSTGARLFFTANDLVHGQELWVHP